MGDLVESASAILSQAERRVELSAQNIANISTPGYKKKTGFQSLLASGNQAFANDTSNRSSVDFSNGKEINTGSPNDLAIMGEGFFVVSSGERALYTRQGQFQRDREGRLVTAQGHALQTVGGGDLVLDGPEFKVAEDGTVLQNGRPLARVAVVVFADQRMLTPVEGGMFAAPADQAADAETPLVRQGVLEASNVSTGDEMVAMMEALRRAEAAQRIVNVYDDLMGRALTSFGQQ